MRNFLSYGPDSNEELVIRIKNDLENAATMSGSTKAKSRPAMTGGARSQTASWERRAGAAA
jgi:hypothetical protein